MQDLSNIFFKYLNKYQKTTCADLTKRRRHYLFVWQNCLRCHLLSGRHARSLLRGQRRVPAYRQ